MASKKKLLQAAAGSAGGAGLDIDEVFSTYLYEGNGGNQTFTNNIDLSGEGGLVWIKSRDATSDHSWVDTARGVGKRISSNSTSAQDTYSGYLSAFNSNGFTIGYSVGTNNNGDDYTSWTFRKAPKFFDVVTYTGTGSARTISHNLGSVPGMIIVKRTSAVADWEVYHREILPTNLSLSGHFKINLNKTDARSNEANIWNDTAPTSTEFTVGSDSATNADGSTYVAYLFAHNDGDGGFGPDADQDIIKCGSYTGNGSTTGPSINLGFEPQLVMVKSATSSSAWTVVDDMRGMTVDGTVDPILYWNFNYSEDTDGRFTPQPTGFQVRSRGSTVNTSGETYIYMAIRRGPLAEPESASDVFTSVLGDGSGTPSIKTNNHVTDFGIAINKTGGGSVVGTRLLGTQQLQTHTSNAESTNSFFNWDFMNGWHTWTGLNTNYINWNWKRAPSYFDVVTYTGTGSARTVSHNLGAVPEMMWIKGRNQAASWIVGGSAIGNGTTNFLILNSNSAMSANTSYFNNTAQTSSVLNIGASAATNNSGSNYIAYLFATVAGVSKVGSYTGNGSTQNIDCGFSSGARFVLIKSSTQATEWNVFDTARGIVSGNDPALLLDTTDAEYTSYDLVDPYSSGFAVNYVGAFNGTNTSGQTYIFYAIA